MNLRYGLVLGALALAPGVSMAQWSANVGFMSDYVFRGVYQSATSAMGGVDYEHDSGFYAGTWWADVDDGLETDLYFGYGGEAGDFSYGIGYTEYLYTDYFDSGYGEVNLGLGWMGLSLDVAIGEWDGALDSDTGAEIPGTDEDYTFTALGYEYEGLYVTFGSWDWDISEDYDYVEIGYGLTWEGIDFSVALINSSDQAFDVSGSPFVDDTGTTLTDNQFVFTISRAFDLGSD